MAPHTKCMTNSLYAVFAGIWVCATGNAHEIITVHYHERPPYYETKGNTISGLIIEPATEAFNKAGIPFHWQLTPPLRQLQILQDNIGRHCAVGWFKTAEREQFAQYSLPIYKDLAAVLFTRRDDVRFEQILSKEQLLNSPLVWLRKQGYSYGAELDQLVISKRIKNMESTGDNVSMARMISHARADYFILAGEEAAQLSQTLKAENQDIRIRTVTGLDPGQYRHILCTRTIEPDTMEALNQAIKDLQLPHVVPDAEITH